MTDALWIVEAYPWDTNSVGGVFYQTQARALARHKVSLTVSCPTPMAPWPLPRLEPRWRRYAAAPTESIDEGVRVIRPRYVGVPREPSWSRPDRLMARAVWRSRAAWMGARLIHGHSAVTGLAAWRLARRLGLPLVLTFHGGDLNTWPERHPERVGDLRRAAHEAHAVITVSEALAQRARELTGVNAVHLPLGSDHRALAALAVPRDQARASLAPLDDRIVVLFVGNMLAAKGVRELVDAILARGDRFLGILVGHGPEQGYRIGDSQATSCLRYVGLRPHRDIARYMSAADVLVLPSYAEGLPTVLVEAGSLGLPVIASAVGGIPGLLGSDRGTLLGEVSATAIGAALDAFERDRPGASAAAARLRGFVQSEHDVDTNAARLLDIYRSTMTFEQADAVVGVRP